MTCLSLALASPLAHVSRLVLVVDFHLPFYSRTRGVLLLDRPRLASVRHHTLFLFFSFLFLAGTFSARYMDGLGVKGGVGCWSPRNPSLLLVAERAAAAVRAYTGRRQGRIDLALAFSLTPQGRVLA